MTSVKYWARLKRVSNSAIGAETVEETMISLYVPANASNASVMPEKTVASANRRGIISAKKSRSCRQLSEWTTPELSQSLMLPSKAFLYSLSVKDGHINLLTAKGGAKE